MFRPACFAVLFRHAIAGYFTRVPLNPRTFFSPSFGPPSSKYMPSCRHSFCPLQGDLEVAADVVANFTGLVVLVCGCFFFFGRGICKKAGGSRVSAANRPAFKTGTSFFRKKSGIERNLSLAYICTALLKASVQTPSLVQR